MVELPLGLIYNYRHDIWILYKKIESLPDIERLMQTSIKTVKNHFQYNLLLSY